MGGLDIAQWRMPQDGSLVLNGPGGLHDVRLATLPTIYGEKMVLRLMKETSKLPTVEQLGFEQQELKAARRLLKSRSGLIVITGPTGSGKTTTLYSFLAYLNEQTRNIVTLEDPVELKLAGLNQMQVNPILGLTFAAGLRAILRQDPDVIMVGEIRDQETADIAVAAALTGHLVFSTLHTEDTANCILRMLDLGVEPYRLRGALRGIIAQKLYRLTCLLCRGDKCLYCNHTGYRGRSGLFEVMSCGAEFSALPELSIKALKELCHRSKQRFFHEIAAEKVAKQKTSLDELLF
ncbi:MAG: hypothetical protein RLZ12_352 [Bacillota bacterium]